MPAKQKNNKPEAVRTCIASGKKYPKKDMIRFVKKSDGTIVVDLTGKVAGRGANMAMVPENFEIAIKKKAFNKALRLDASLSESQISDLRKQFLDAIEYRNFRKGKERVSIKISKAELDELTK